MMVYTIVRALFMLLGGNISTITSIYDKIIVRIKKIWKKKKKGSPKAQTTPDTSFGPVFIITSLFVKYYKDHTYILYKKVLASIKNRKKNSPMAQTTPDTSFGPVFVMVVFGGSGRHRNVPI